MEKHIETLENQDFNNFILETLTWIFASKNYFLTAKNCLSFQKYAICEQVVE